MSTPIEIETTILGGLPVRVHAHVQPAEPDVGIPYPWPEDIQIFWLGIRPREVPQSVYERLTDKDNELLNEQIMERYYEDM